MENLIITFLGKTYDKMYHGNDMTYNSKEKKILMAGPNDYKGVWEFNPNDFTKVDSSFNYTSFKPEKKKYTVNESVTAIGYNNIDDIYYVKSGVNAVSFKTDFSTINNSFSTPKNQTGQGIEFYNGYLYVTTYESGNCPSRYELYCSKEEKDIDSAIIYVYNVKQDSKGNLSPNYGRLVERLYIEGGKGQELETVSFKDGTMYLAVEGPRRDENDKILSEIFHIYSVPLSNFNYNIGILSVDYSIDYRNGMVIISSDEALKKVDGWTLSSDEKTLTKEVTSTSETSVKICDRYSNCQTETLKRLDTIDFPDNETTYTGSPIKINTANATSNSSIDYTYYSDSKCTNQINAPINVGNYYVKATSKGNSKYISNSKCSSLKINKGIPTVSLEKKDYNYTGDVIKISGATAKTPNGIADVSLKYSYKYYTDSDCTKLISNSNGATSVGGTPIFAGNYYVQATSSENSNLYSASSSCVSYNINKVPASFSIASSIGLGVNSSTSVNYNYNGEGTLKCSSSNKEMVTCNIGNGKLDVFSKKNGSAIITINIGADLNHTAHDDVKINVNVEGSLKETRPNITIAPDGNSSYVKNQDINVLIEGTDSPIKPQQDIYFAFTTSATAKPNYVNKIKTSNNVSQDRVIVSIPSEFTSNLTGTYYLWIKDGIVDDDNGLSYEKVSSAFKFNNTVPDIDAVIINNKKKTKGTIKATSLSNIEKYEYSIDGINYTNIDNIFYINTNLNNLYYIRVTDAIGNVGTVEVMTVEEDKPLIEVYVLDRDGNQVINDIISNDRDLEYNLHISVPSIDNIVEKYEEFSVKDVISDKIEISQDNIKVLNKSLDDVTDNFKVEFRESELIVTPNDISATSFYDEEYTVKIKGKIKEDYQPTDEDKGIFENEGTIDYNDKKITSSVSSKLIYEEYTNIPNTKLDFNKFLWFIGFVCIVGGVVIFSKIKEFKQ